MIIGIKYCGGCNPKYNRIDLVKNLMNEYNDAIFETARDNVFYDLVIVICGCSSSCVNHEKLIGKRKKIITDEKDFNEIKDIINNLEI